MGAQMEKKHEFSINTAIKVYSENLITYDTVTDIGIWKPKTEDGKEPAFYDENDTLYYYWIQGIVTTMGFNAEDSEQLCDDLLGTIYNLQHKIVTADMINEKNGDPLLMDGPKAPTPEEGAKPIDEHFINVKLLLPDNDESIHFEVTTDITGQNENKQNRTLLYYYWAHALAECVTFVNSKALQDYLAKSLLNILLTAGDGIVASIND